MHEVRRYKDREDKVPGLQWGVTHGSEQQKDRNTYRGQHAPRVQHSPQDQAEWHAIPALPVPSSVASASGFVLVFKNFIYLSIFLSHKQWGWAEKGRENLKQMCTEHGAQCGA